VNTDLGVYFKFNEGITGVTATDSTVLDYSGRLSNGTWTGYSTSSRNTGSAIVLSNAAIKEFKDPIIYSTHPAVVSLKEQLVITGSDHDAGNNSSIYKSIPAWITEEDEEGSKNVKYLTQIMASYFDTLHMQIDAMNKLKDIVYVSGSNKPFPFANKLLDSYGFVSPNIFLDADVLEKLADRSEDKIYEKSLNDTKNIIYQNIYNNLTYIYKSKGTEKSFRNLIRCFGIDDELIKLQMYARNTEYEYRENRRTLIVNDRVANFNTSDNQNAVVFSYSSSLNANSTGYTPAVSQLSEGFALTLECDVLFPQKPRQTSVISSDVPRDRTYTSLFGMHSSSGETDTTWALSDDVNFQVFASRDEQFSPNITFVLSGTSGGHMPLITSSLYQDVYTDTRWNLSVGIRPERYPLANLVDEGATGNYTAVFRGTQIQAGEVINTFSVSGSITNPPAGFMTGSRRFFVGAHRTNFTGAVLQPSDVAVDACRFWLDYVEDTALRQHALDAENYGALQPAAYAFPFNVSASYGDVQKEDTLVFNWEFSNNTGSNASGQFVVDDESSGSLAISQNRYGVLGPILGKQYTGLGYGFTTYKIFLCI
jgi:hypothetical protein